MWFCGSTNKAQILNSKYELNHSLYPKLRLMPHQVLHPSHLLWVWLFSDDFLKLACRSLHTWRTYLKRISYFWCSFSAFNKIFPQCPTLIRVKWFLLILPRSLFTPIALRNCFRIFVLSVFSLFVYISSTSILFEISSFTIWVSESQFLINESFSGLLYIRFYKI